MSTEEKIKNIDPDTFKFLWLSVFLLISVRGPPDNKFLFIYPQIFI